jgi:hypothetical protein
MSNNDETTLDQLIDWLVEHSTPADLDSPVIVVSECCGCTCRTIRDIEFREDGVRIIGV